ncbi:MULTISPECIES: ATP-binding protein [unclassified Streptomyces]|uniref:ATP-binding protein n=1 Tax=unclassified Streptomyces TaxID=2593676 RepID=UPI0009390F97|nr:ATP-binding protein [Streptomyces sp. CB02058]OKI98415.1 ATPase [Streptomyces sp. CB02058]
MNETTRLASFREAFYRRERRSVPLVRKFVRQALLDWACEVDIGDVLLCVTELATNALIHGVPPGRGFRVHLTLGHVLRVEVHDSGGGQVREAVPPLDAEWGRGLVLVEALADDWGVGERQPGKTVWCEFAASASKFVERGERAHHLP